MRWAYFSAHAPSERECARTQGGEAFKHIAHCGKWNYAKHKYNGQKGILAFWNGLAPGTHELDEGKELENGLIYFKPDPMPTQADLGKRSPYPSIPVTTHKGQQLSIPLAVGAPRMVSFTGHEMMEFADDFPVLAGKMESYVENLKDDEEDIALTDQMLVNLVCKAIQQNYKVTPELLEDLRWITTGDIIPIYRAVMGCDPLAFGGENDISSSAPQESNESHDLPLVSGA